MTGLLGYIGVWILICIHVTPLVSAQGRTQFVHYDFTKADLHRDGMATIEDGLLQITGNTTKSTGHAFHKTPMKFTASSSFSTEFVFAIIPLHSPISFGQGMAFVVAPTTDLRSNGTETSGLGLFSTANDNNTTNHILAVEPDTNDSAEALDRSSNHVGIDINSKISVESADASYYNETEGKNQTLLLASGNSILIWIDYDGIEKRLNVTLSPVPTPKPDSPLLSSSIKPSVPLLSRYINISEIFNETMFVGFSGSTGTLKSDQYILAWSFKKGGQAESLDLSKVLDPPNPPPPPISSPPPSPPPSSLPPPTLPPTSPPKSGSNRSSRALILGTTIAAFCFLIILGGIVYLLYKKKKYAEVLEQWEKEYSPQRYSFRNLYKATKGFKENQLLGAGGFGKVYMGMLPSGNFKAEEVKMHLKIGMLCSQSNPENRPSMRLIVQYLEGNVTVPSISYDTSGFGMPNISNEMVTQLTATSSLANFSFEDVTVLFGGR
ncbi:unnamed protein product [Eruca vesicaria subsp. sativa]|uniref:Legume lectin domain-containing protein n=1 Tax=Eruca vesicaria subsp. sativa TaxID=29727 RepID=A0ABC8IYU5_ERUVS|nr:unnamed protein product [Eruca vesicaria subsp. sativa]